MSGHWKPGLYSNSYSNADEYRRKTAVRGEQRNEERSALRTLANAGGQAQAYPVCATKYFQQNPTPTSYTPPPAP